MRPASSQKKVENGAMTVGDGNREVVQGKWKREMI